MLESLVEKQDFELWNNIQEKMSSSFPGYLEISSNFQTLVFGGRNRNSFQQFQGISLGFKVKEKDPKVSTSTFLIKCVLDTIVPPNFFEIFKKRCIFVNILKLERVLFFSLKPKKVLKGIELWWERNVHGGYASLKKMRFP